MTGDHSTIASRTIGIAIPIPEPYAQELQRCRRAFGDPLADAIPAHITLLPPTEVLDTALPDIEEHLRSCAERFGSFDIALRGTGTFRPVSPVVFVRVDSGSEDCALVENVVRSGPLDRAVKFDYHPHVTVAHELPEANLERAMTELADFAADFRVSEFSLYGHGADQVWRPERQFPLTGERAVPGDVGL